MLLSQFYDDVESLRREKQKMGKRKKIFFHAVCEENVMMKMPELIKSSQPTPRDAEALRICERRKRRNSLLLLRHKAPANGNNNMIE